MKINEVVTEAVNQSTGTPNPNQPAAQQPAQKTPGMWNKLKSAFTGANQQKQIAKGIGAQANEQEIQLELNSFNKYLSQATYGQQITPELLQATAKNFVTRKYPGVSPEVMNLVGKITNVKSANDFIAQSYNSMMANALIGGDSSQAAPAEPAAQSTQPQSQASQEPAADYSTPAYQRREKSVSKPEYHPASTDPIDPSLLGNNQVQVAGHGIITKGPDGQWRDEQEDVISRPADINELERRLTQRLQTKQMAKPPAPFQPGAPRRPRSKRARRK